MKSEIAEQVERSAPEAGFTYSGYLEIGDRRLAIINGIEYETGDELAMGGYIVRGIYPNRVVIEVKWRKEKIIVPLEEEVL